MNILINIIEDPADILVDARSKERLFKELKSVLNEKGMIVSIDVNEPAGEEDTSSERPVSQE